MTSVRHRAITFTARERAELVTVADEAPLGPGEIAGRTLFSLVSPGTELAGSYQGERFPATPGYAAVFAVDAVGTQVEGVAPGDLRFAMGNHRSRQRFEAAATVPVPAGLAPELAPFCRLLGVTMSTLTTTTARPPGTVLVTGLGPVGHLGAQLFHAHGYRVVAVDPIAARREWAARAGLPRVEAAVPASDPTVQRQVDLVLECSGHEAAALDGARVTRPRGEVALVGAPWVRRTDLHLHDLLREVFFHYVVVRSGWEWELPNQPTPFRTGSVFGNFAAALELLAARRVRVDGLFDLLDPAQAQAVYRDLAQRRAPNLFQVFDWRQVGAP